MEKYLVKISGIDGAIFEIGTEENQYFEKWVNLFENHSDFIKTLLRIRAFYRYDFYRKGCDKPFATYFAN